MVSARGGKAPRPLDRVVRLIHEVHRRSLWQVLAVYLAASWFVLQASEHVVDRYLLPEWVYGFAVVLLLTGLPIVLATAMVREEPVPPGTGGASPTGESVGGESKPADTEPELGSRGAPPLAPLAASLRSSPVGSLLTWRRALAGGLLGFGLLAVFAGFIVTRGVPRVAEARGAAGDAFAERGWLVVAEFESSAEDTELARAAREALAVDLQQSAHVNVHGRSTISGVLSRMGLPDTTRLDVALALEVAERVGGGAVLTANVSRIGGQYVLSGRVLRTGTGDELFAVRTATGEARLLDGVETLSREIRRRLGETRTALRQSRPLPEVTTRSLEALKLYADAENALGARQNAERARALAMEAIRVDPGFAMAHRLAGTAAGNMLMWGESQIHLAAAYDLRERLTDRERWHVEAAYYASVLMEHRQAADVYELILDRYPDDSRAANNLSVMYGAWLNDPEAAYRAITRATNPELLGPTWFVNTAAATTATGRFAEMDSLARASAEAGFPGIATRLRAVHALAVNDPRRALALCDSALTGSPGAARWADDREYCGHLDLAAGRIETGIARLEEVAREHRARQRYHPMANTISAIAVGEAMRGRSEAAVARLERLLAEAHTAEIPDLDRLIIRTNLRVIAAYLERPDLMERIGAAFAPYPDPDHWFSRMGEDLVRAADALVDGDPHATLRVLHAAIPGDLRPAGWILWDELLRALAYESLGEPDSAAVHFGRAADSGFFAGMSPPNGRLFLPITLLGLAEAHEARGDREAARVAYSRLLELRSDADPELGDEVADVRAAVARLGGEVQR